MYRSLSYSFNVLTLLFLSPITENYFPVTSKIAAAFTAIGCLGQLVFAVIVGNYIDSYPSVFVWVTLWCSLSSCVLFLVVSHLCKHWLKSKKNQSNGLELTSKQTQEYVLVAKEPPSNEPLC